jgi:hypothetical protein
MQLHFPLYDKLIIYLYLLILMISEKILRRVGKGKRADVYLEVRKRRGIYFWNETSTFDQ